MAKHHTKFLPDSVPSSLEKPDPNGRIIVTYKQDKKVIKEEFDTVLFAVGRYAVTKGLNLENAGVKCEKNGKFIVNDEE